MRPRLLVFATVLAALTGLTATCHAAEADANQNAAALEQAVLDGKDIHAVLDLSKCTEHETGKSGPPLRGSLHPEGYMVHNDHSVVFSVTHFTVRNDKTPVNEFISFQVQPTGKVDMHSVFLNAANYTVLREASFACAIGDGLTFHW
jgi:hypothetical protein